MSNVLDEAGKLLATMSRAEKAQLLQWVARDIGDAYPGIDTDPGVAAGDACIAGTRIMVWTLEQMRRLALTDAQILQAYPTLRAEDLANAWGYVRAHREEIDRQIAANEQA